MVFKRPWSRDQSNQPEKNPTPEVKKEEASMLGRDRESGYTPAESTHHSAGTSNGTVLSGDAEFKGSLNFKSNLRIDGRFEGEIKSPGTVHVGQEGEVKAEVEVGNAVIEGKITGNIVAKDKLELRSTAQLFGDIKATRLVINEGVVFVGKCEVNPSNSKIEALRPETKTQAKSPEAQDNQAVVNK